MLSVVEMATGDRGAVGRATDSQRLFSWGANSYGQLGTGHCEDTSVSEALPSISRDHGSQITAINGGGGHSLISLANGNLLVCGSNDKGQLGLGSTENVSVPKLVNTLKGETIIKAVGGWDFTVMLNEKGEVYVTGSNSFYQLGMPIIKEKFITVPMKMSCLDGVRIVDVAAGLRHGLALTDDGHIYQWGRRKSPKPKEKNLIDPSPKAVNLPPDLKGKVTKICAGSYFFMGLTDFNEIICWGENNYGQLTLLPDKTKAITVPYIIPSHYFDGKVTDIQTGWTHVLALTDRGTVYSWGRADYGQLGRVVDLQFDPIPQPIKGLKDVTCLRCGSEHNIALTGNGKVLSWGWNEHGLCGNGNEDNVMAPQQVTALGDHVIRLIGCGSGHSFALEDIT